MRHFANFYVDLQQHAEDTLRGLVEKHPTGESGYISGLLRDSNGKQYFKYLLEESQDNNLTSSPDIREILLKDLPKNSTVEKFQIAHTHPSIINPRSLGLQGKGLNISKYPNYPSLQDYKAQENIREDFDLGDKLSPSLVLSNENNYPTRYIYDTKKITNPYSKLNKLYDEYRFKKQDEEITGRNEYEEVGNGIRYYHTYELTQNPEFLLKRAALQEKISNSKDNFFHQPWLSVKRYGAPLEKDLPDIQESRLGETVAAANAVGLAHGGYTLKKAYDERKRQKQADDVQLTNKYQ